MFLYLVEGSTPNMILPNKRLCYAQHIIRESDNKQFLAAFAYSGYTFFVKDDEPNDESNTVAVHNEDEFVLEGIEANKLLSEYLDAYCRQGGSMWCSKDFQGALSYRLAEILEDTKKTTEDIANRLK